MLQKLNNRKYLAVADEEGYVSILDTTKPLPRGLHDDNATPAQWLAHHNAIFDLAWNKVACCCISISSCIASLRCIPAAST